MIQQPVTNSLETNKKLKNSTRQNFIKEIKQNYKTEKQTIRRNTFKFLFLYNYI